MVCIPENIRLLLTEPAQSIYLGVSLCLRDKLYPLHAYLGVIPLDLMHKHALAGSVGLIEISETG